MNSAFVQVLTAIAMVLTIVVPMTYYFKGEHNKNRYKKSLAANVSGFFGLLLIATVVSFAGATTASAATEAGAGLATGLGYIGAALVTGLSGIGSGIAVRHRKYIQFINPFFLRFQILCSGQKHSGKYFSIYGFVIHHKFLLYPNQLHVHLLHKYRSYQSPFL